MKAQMSGGCSALKGTTLSKVLWWHQPCTHSLSWTKRHSSGWTDGHALIVSRGFSSLSWWPCAAKLRWLPCTCVCGCTQYLAVLTLLLLAVLQKQARATLPAGPT